MKSTHNHAWIPAQVLSIMAPIWVPFLYITALIVGMLMFSRYLRRQKAGKSAVSRNIAVEANVTLHQPKSLQQNHGSPRIKRETSTSRSSKPTHQQKKRSSCPLSSAEP